MEPQSRLGGLLAEQFDHIIDEAVREARVGTECAKEARLEHASRGIRAEVEDLVILIAVKRIIIECGMIRNLS